MRPVREAAAILLKNVASPEKVEELVRAVLVDDPGAFDRLVVRHGDRLFRMIRAQIGDLGAALRQQSL